MTTTSHDRVLTIALWSAQIFLAVVFTAAGAFKVFVAPAALLAKAPDLATLPLPLVRFIGIAELAAAVGLILPAATRIAPILTPIAAACVMPILAGAMVFNVKAGHVSSLLLAAACAALAFFVARTRFRESSAQPVSGHVVGDVGVRVQHRLGQDV